MCCFACGADHPGSPRNTPCEDQNLPAGKQEETQEMVVEDPLIKFELSSPLASHLNKEYTDDLNGLLEKRYIRVLTTFNRTNFFFSDNKPYGFEYSLLKAYESFLNKETDGKGLRVVLEFVPVSRDQLIPALNQGLGDIAAAGLTITRERLDQVDFTLPYLTGVNEIVVAHKQVLGLNKVEDLSGRSLFVRQSSSYYESLVKLNQELQRQGLAPVRIQKADESLETEDILEIVNSGAVGITIADSNIARIWSTVFKDLQVLDHLRVRTGGKIAWMVRKNCPELKANLNSFLRTHRKGTLFGNIQIQRYFKNNKWIKNLLKEKAIKRQHEHAGLIKEYASQYGFDWLLIMAQAYQESELDHSQTNPSGAVGIMQVLPSTATDRHVDISDIQSVEKNIHAGVKYLAFLKDHYFSGKDLRERDRIRFSMAAYNAGPAKIRRARSLAKEMGLNTNRWFRNVEMAVLAIVGQETVQYVSNINKYYVLLKLYAEREQERQSAKKKIVTE